jgi:alkyldihydroxyacetonephosphate synthase
MGSGSGGRGGGWSRYRDHRDPYQREVGPLAVRALRAVKAELDPVGILNPGVLIADR